MAIMTPADINYEQAFEAYLQSQAVPYVPANEVPQSVFTGAKLKSFDFVLHPPQGAKWLVDLKGRQFPYGSAGSRRYWENWVTQADLDGLAEWEAAFGDNYEARLVFAYLLEGPPERWPAIEPFAFGHGRFAFYAVRLADYRTHCRQRSPRWSTVCVPRRTFRTIARPVAAEFHAKQGTPAAG